MSKYNILTDKLNTYFSRNKIVSASAKPTNGTWNKGDLVISSNITSTVFGWICKESGTPGTWLTLDSAEDITGEVNSHTHDNRYYKKAEIDTKLNGKSDSGHEHDTRYHRVNLTAITAGGNFDDYYTINGTYNVSSGTSLTGAPYTGGIYGLLDVSIRSVGDVKQHFTDHLGREFIRYRNGNSGKWSTWTKVYSSAQKPTWTEVDNKPSTFPPATHNHDDRYYTEGEVNNKLDAYFKKTGGTITGSTMIESDFSTKNGFIIPKKASEGIRGFHMNTYKTQDGSNKTYAEFVLEVGEGSGWDWGKSLKLYQDGVLGAYKIETGDGGYIKLANNSSLYAKTKNGDRQYNLIGLDTNDNIYLGWGNETYINVKNTTSFEHDVTMKKYLRLNNGGNYNGMFFGKNHVRFEYEESAAQIYVAGSETQQSGFGTSFAAKYLECKEPYIIIGGSKIYAQGSDPGAVGAGSVWIKTV